jgi:outer membrane protein assembly factor BamB
VLACVFVLGGCTTIKGWFGGKDDKKASEPAELTDITPTATVAKMWSVGAGKGEGKIGIRQGPAVADGKVFVAAVKGGVSALDLQTGACSGTTRPRKSKTSPTCACPVVPAWAAAWLRSAAWMAK